MGWGGCEGQQGAWVAVVAGGVEGLGGMAPGRGEGAEVGRAVVPPPPAARPTSACAPGRVPGRSSGSWSAPAHPCTGGRASRARQVGARTGRPPPPSPTHTPHSRRKAATQPSAEPGSRAAGAGGAGCPLLTWSPPAWPGWPPGPGRRPATSPQLPAPVAAPACAHQRSGHVLQVSGRLVAPVLIRGWRPGRPCPGGGGGGGPVAGLCGRALT